MSWLTKLTDQLGGAGPGQQIQAIMSPLLWLSQWRNEQAATANIRARFGEGKGNISDLQNWIMGRPYNEEEQGFMDTFGMVFNNLSDEQKASIRTNPGDPLYGHLQKFESLLSQNQGHLNKMTEEVTGGYYDRWQQGMEYLKGMGEQAKRDIRQDYASRAAEIPQQLAVQGFANTTMAPSMKLGVEREKQAALGRLGEDLRREYLSTYAGLSGDYLGSLERVGQLPMQYGMDLTNMMNDWIYSYDDVYPDTGYRELSNRQGQAFAPSIVYPSPSILGPMSQSLGDIGGDALDWWLMS